MFIFTCRFYAADRDLLAKVNFKTLGHGNFWHKYLNRKHFVGKGFVSGWGNRKISSN